MPRAAQALRVKSRQPRRAHVVRFSALLCLAVLATGCASGGFSLRQAEVDRSILTGSIDSKPAPQPDTTRTSDENTIRNAVSSADLDGLGGGSVPWANPDTGSRGAISALTETRRSGRLCRTFTTSRESFDGVALYKGETCMGDAGAWNLLRLSAV